MNNSNKSDFPANRPENISNPINEIGHLSGTLFFKQ